MTNEADHLSFWEHVEDLRLTLLRCLAVIASGFMICMLFYDALFGFLSAPLLSASKQSQPFSTKVPRGTENTFLEHYEVRTERLFNKGSTPVTTLLPSGEPIEILPGEFISYTTPVKKEKLALLSPLEGFLTAIRVSFWCGLSATSPLWLFFLYQFASPAMRTREKRVIVPFLIFSVLFFLVGAFFAYSVTLPFANAFFYSFNANVGYNLWSLAAYTEYTLLVTLGNGIAFEAVVILGFLVHRGAVSPEGMRKKRRHAIISIFFFSALLTPPDVLTQCMLAIPLLGMYELAILYGQARRSQGKNQLTDSL